jgi:hypothetical protein
MHLWHAQHSASSSFSSKHHHQQQHHDVPTLFFNPPTPAQRELYFKTFGAVVENEENKRDDWHFEFSQWGTTHFKPYPDPDKRNEYYIPDPKQIHKIKGDGHCLFR